MFFKRNFILVFIILLVIIFYSCASTTQDVTYRSAESPQNSCCKSLNIILVTSHLTTNMDTDISVKWMNDDLNFSKNIITRCIKNRNKKKCKTETIKKNKMPWIKEKLINKSIKAFKNQLSQIFNSVSLNGNLLNSVNQDVIMIVPSIQEVTSYVDSPYAQPFNDANVSIIYQIKIINNKGEEIDTIETTNSVNKRIQAIFATRPSGLAVALFPEVINKASESFISKLLQSKKMANFSENYFQQRTLPANIIVKVQYSDNNSLIPNSTIDAKEESRITISVTNEGKGTAFDVKVKTETDYRNIDFPESVSIGDIPPGETKEVTVDLTAGLDLASGKAPFTIYAAEKRGYDSKGIKMLIPTARLEKPDLVFADYRIDDGNTGLAQGNGNGVAESGETIELTAFIKNQGRGKAIGVTMSAGEINTGIKWVRDEITVGIIPPGRTVKAKVAFTIPRNFDAGEIRSLLKASDIRGVSNAKKKVALAYSKQSPELQYAYRILSRGNEVNSVINGEQYEIELTVSNRGKLPASNVVTSITPYKDIQLDRQSLDMGEIKADSSLPVQRIGLFVPRTFMESSLPLNVKFTQSDFISSENVINIPVNVKSPKLSYNAHLLSKNSGNILENGESATLEIHVLNEGSLPAEAVALSIESMDKDMSIIGKKKDVLGRIPAKSRSETIKFQISTKRRINIGDKYLKINIDQKDFPPVLSRYALNITAEDLKVIDLAAEDSKKSSAIGVPASNRAPSIHILSPQSGETVDDNKVYLAVDVADFKSIESVRVEVNGLIMPIRDNVGGFQSLRERKIRTDIPLKEGGNHIIVYAYNSDNVLTKREIVISRRSEENIDTPLVTNIKNPDAIAVVIGISRYENPDIPAVDYARHDAEIMKKYLQRTLGFKEENIFEQYDSKASFSKLRAIFKRKLGNLITPGKSDVFIFYSGHGVPGIEDKQPYLAPYDFDPEAIEDTGYNLNDFYKQVAKLKARNVTIVIDACFSGSSEKGMVIKGISPVFLEVDNPVMKVKNSVVFTSSTGRQVSSWYYKKRHGLFTYYFLMGLRGSADADKDGRITAGEMGKYLTANVPKQARSLRSREQTPQVFGDKNRVLLSY